MKKCQVCFWLVFFDGPCCYFCGFLAADLVPQAIGREHEVTVLLGEVKPFDVGLVAYVGPCELRDGPPVSKILAELVEVELLELQAEVAD